MSETVDVEITEAPALESKFTDKLLPYYFVNLFFILSSVLSASLLYPLAFYLLEKRKINYSYVDGKKLRFDGKLSEAYIIYITGFVIAAVCLALVNLIIEVLPFNLPSKLLNLLVSGATALVNFLFLTGRIRRWKIKNTHYDDSVGGVSRLKRNLIKCGLVNIGTSLLGLITAGLSYPFSYKLKQSYYIDMTVTDGDDVCLKGKTSSLCAIWYPGLLLCVITLGLYLPVLNYSIYRWTAENTHVKQAKK